MTGHQERRELQGAPEGQHHVEQHQRQAARAREKVEDAQAGVEGPVAQPRLLEMVAPPAELDAASNLDTYARVARRLKLRLAEDMLTGQKAPGSLSISVTAGTPHTAPSRHAPA